MLEYPGELVARWREAVRRATPLSQDNALLDNVMGGVKSVVVAVLLADLDLGPPTLMSVTSHR